MKLKSVLCLTATCLILGGCYYYNPEDRAEERADKLAQKQAEQGCLLLDSHEAYRRCLIATAQRNSPKTFTTTNCVNGQPVAVIKGTHNCTENCNAQTVITTEITRTIEMEPVEVESTSQTVTTTKTTEVVAAPVPAVKAQETPVQKDQTWWDQYQATKKVQTTTVKCPCEDPNDPCPQCVEK